MAATPLVAWGQGEGSIRFELQPGLRSSNVISTTNGLGSTTGFNLRFATRFRTGSRWLTPVIGGSIMPYGSSDANDLTANAPELFAGNVFPLVAAGQTGGWATVELPLLVYQEYGGGGNNNRRLYGRDVYGQIALYLHLGKKLLGVLGESWNDLDAYGFVEQNLTPNRDSATGGIDRFNPVILLGVSLAIGGSPEGSS